MTGSMDLVGRLRAAIEQSKSDNGDYLYLGAPDPLLVDLLAAHEHQAETTARLTAENERAWRERNVAHAKVKAWEAVVYVEGLSLRSVRVDEWGPGEGGQTTVPDVTPKRLVDLLDELKTARAALHKED